MHTLPIVQILLADDHPLLREGLKAMLRQQPHFDIVGEAQDGREAVDLYRQRLPDVTLMDVRMPAMDGIEATRRIRSEFPRANIVMLSAYDAQEDIYQAIHAGARSYLRKNVELKELLHAIMEAAQGRLYLSRYVTTQTVQRMSATQLSPRELEVLQQMKTGRCNQEIAAVLFIAEGTVKAHVHTLMGKLGASDRTQAVVTALRTGLVRLEEDEAIAKESGASQPGTGAAARIAASSS